MPGMLPWNAALLAEMGTDLETGKGFARTATHLFWGMCLMTVLYPGSNPAEREPSLSFILP